jgi:hypothetical protein
MRRCPRLPDTEGASKQGRGSSHLFFPRPSTGRVVLMKRIMLVVTAALVMAAMMVAMAAPAFAERDRSQMTPGNSGAMLAPCNSGGTGQEPSGNGTLVFRPDQTGDYYGFVGTCDFWRT